jgi:predicted kinase
MKELIIMVGLPRAGKSEWAKSTGHPIVSVDAIQYAICGKHLIPLDEFNPMRITFAEYMISSLFLAGHDVVIFDDCNIHTLKRLPCKIFAQNNGYKITYKCIKTDVETCIARASKLKNAEWLTEKIKTLAKQIEWPE